MLVLLLATLVLSAPGDPQFWRYTDAQGHVYLTNEFETIPPALRKNAQPFALSAAPAEKKTSTPNEASIEQALREGTLSADELDELIASGAFRTSALSDSYRHAREPGDERDAAPGHLNRLAANQYDAMGTLSTLHVLRAYLRDIRASDKFWWSLGGQAAVVVAAIMALPFILRRYRTPETRRVVRASIFFMVIIVSATGQLLLFRSETETLGRLLMNLTAADTTSTLMDHPSPQDLL